MVDTQTNDARDRGSDRAVHIHRYPDRLIYLLAGLSATIFCIPMILLFAGEAITPAGLLSIWVPAGIPAILAFSALRYSVVINGDIFVIKTALSIREVRLAEIAKTAIVSARNGPQLKVELMDGTVMWFNGMLTDFDGLVNELVVRQPGVRH